MVARPEPPTEERAAKTPLVLDGRHLAYVVFGGFLVSALVFTAGFFTGQQHAGPREVAVAEVAGIAALDTSAEDPAAPDAGAPLPPLTYEERLSEPLPPEVADDPALRLMAQDRPDLGPPLTPEERAAFRAQTGAAGDVAAPDAMAPPAAVAGASGATGAVAGANLPAAAEGGAAVPAAPISAAVAAARPASPPANARHSLDVQGFRRRAEADAFARLLDGREQAPYVREDRDARGVVGYRVRIGAFATLKAARDFQRRFERREGIGSRIVPYAP